MGFIILIGWIASFYYCGKIVNDKGYGEFIGYFFGAIFGPFAVIPVAGLPDRKLKSLMKKFIDKHKAIKKEGEVKNTN